MNDLPWEALEHTSDLELLIRGRSEEELFKKALEALLAQIVEPATVKCVEKRELEIDAESSEELFLDWLRELLHLALTRGFLAHHAEETRLSKDTARYKVHAVICGETLNENRHELLHEVKTVTYQEFHYGKEGDFWSARVVFDV